MKKMTKPMPKKMESDKPSYPKMQKGGKKKMC